MRLLSRPLQTTLVFVTSSFPPARTAIEPPPIPSLPITVSPSTTTLEQYESVDIASAYPRNLPVEGSKPQISYGTPITKSVRFSSTFTSTGVPHVEPNPSAFFRHTSLPVAWSKAISDWLSAAAGTITKSSNRIGLDDEPQL